MVRSLVRRARCMKLRDPSELFSSASCKTCQGVLSGAVHTTQRLM
jgi:hypothetical protein